MTEHPVRIPALPSDAAKDRLAGLLAPLERVTQPKFYGLDTLAQSGSLFVGNHTIYGFLDLPFMQTELWKQRRITIRGLGEHAHYAIPLWRDALEQCGMVRGTRDNVRALMRDGQNILVFPGGAREVNKRKGEAYQLMWKERLGFARLAIEQGYPIQPFAAVGAEEMFDIVLDDTDVGFKQVAALVQRFAKWPMQPLVKGIGPTPIPRPERLYFWFGDPIDTTRFDGKHTDDDAARQVRDEVKAAVEGGIAFLQAERENDPNRNLLKRLVGRVD